MQLYYIYKRSTFQGSTWSVDSFIQDLERYHNSVTIQLGNGNPYATIKADNRRYEVFTTYRGKKL